MLVVDPPSFHFRTSFTAWSLLAVKTASFPARFVQIIYFLIEKSIFKRIVGLGRFICQKLLKSKKPPKRLIANNVLTSTNIEYHKYSNKSIYYRLNGLVNASEGACRRGGNRTQALVNTSLANGTSCRNLRLPLHVVFFD